MKIVRVISLVLLATLLVTINACQAAPVEAPTVSQPSESSHPQFAAKIQKSMISILTAATPVPPVSPTPTLKPKPRITRAPAKLPGEPPKPSRTLEDTDASVKASEKRVLSGDKFNDSLYERPFTSQEMAYQPDLDINTVDFACDEEYFYITIRLHGLNESKKALTGYYGVEFDRTLTGRGDALLVVGKPDVKWSIKNVQLFIDTNKDVGGPTPLIHDDNFKGNGYDKSLPVKGTNIAYARIDPKDNKAVQLAISRSLLTESRFLWGAWAADGSKKQASFDYNDTMTFSAAGSPIKTDAEYPVKGLFSLDNTCRLPYGFEQVNMFYPGMCITGTSTEEGEDCYCTDYCGGIEEAIRCCGQWVCD